jgi:hypothetical protein
MTLVLWTLCHLTNCSLKATINSTTSSPSKSNFSTPNDLTVNVGTHEETHEA